jgi:hypothetical protein
MERWRTSMTSSKLRTPNTKPKNGGQEDDKAETSAKDGGIKRPVGEVDDKKASHQVGIHNVRLTHPQHKSASLVSSQSCLSELIPPGILIRLAPGIRARFTVSV